MRLALALILSLAASPALAQQLQMSVRPGGFALAPADVEVRLRVAPGGRQREVLLEIDGERYYRSSLYPVRQDPASTTLQPPAWYRGLPAGTYVITATLSECASSGCGARRDLERVRKQLLVVDGREDEASTEEP